MIGPSGGGGFIPLYTLLWLATLCCLAIAGIVAARRKNKGDWMRRGPVMNRTVRLFGVLAAICFVGYWFANVDRRHLEGVYDDVVESLDEDRAVSDRSIESSFFQCRETGAIESMLSKQTTIDLPEGARQNGVGISDVALAELEVFGARLDDEGWSIRRFASEAEPRLWGERDDAFFVVALRPTDFAVVVTTTRCLGANFVPLESSGGLLRSDVEEVDTFDQ